MLDQQGRMVFLSYCSCMWRKYQEVPYLGILHPSDMPMICLSVIFIVDVLKHRNIMFLKKMMGDLESLLFIGMAHRVVAASLPQCPASLPGLCGFSGGMQHLAGGICINIILIPSKEVCEFFF